MDQPASNVVAFRRPDAHRPARHPKLLVETVYAAGSIAVTAEDVSTKTAALMLQSLGFLVIEEVSPDGTLRPLARGGVKGALKSPWRLSKPAFSGTIGVPDGESVLA